MGGTHRRLQTAAHVTIAECGQPDQSCGKPGCTVVRLPSISTQAPPAPTDGGEKQKEKQTKTQHV